MLLLISLLIVVHYKVPSCVSFVCTVFSVVFLSIHLSIHLSAFPALLGSVAGRLGHFFCFCFCFVFIQFSYLIPLWHDGVDCLAQLVVRILVLESTGWCNHDATGGSLCLCCCTKSSFRLNVAIRYSFLLT